MAEETTTTTETAKTDTVETKEFDPEAFKAARFKTEEKKETGADARGKTTTTTTSETDKGTVGDDEEHLSNEFTWDKGATETNETATTTETVTTTENKEAATVSATTPVIADFSAFSKELGIDAKDEAEFKAKYKDQIKELQELKALTLSGVTTPEIEKLKPILNLSAEELVRHDMKLRGFSQASIDKKIDIIKDNGTLEIEAEEVKVAINRFIDSKKFEKINAEKQRVAQSEQANRENLKAIRQQMDKTDELFGFKIAKPENMQKARDEHYEYLTSGKFLDEITENPEAAIQAAFLWKHRETIIKTMANKAKSQGKQEVLKNLQNTQLGNAGVVHVAKDEEEGFNPVKFVEGVRNRG